MPCMKRSLCNLDQTLDLVFSDETRGNGVCQTAAASEMLLRTELPPDLLAALKLLPLTLRAAEAEALALQVQPQQLPGATGTIPIECSVK